MRPIASSASSTAETSLAARAADNSTAVLKLHCDLAKAYSRSACCGADDAQFGRARQEQWLYSGGPVMLPAAWRRLGCALVFRSTKNENGAGRPDREEI